MEKNESKSVFTLTFKEGQDLVTYNTVGQAEKAARRMSAEEVSLHKDGNFMYNMVRYTPDLVQVKGRYVYPRTKVQ